MKYVTQMTALSGSDRVLPNSPDVGRLGNGTTTIWIQRWYWAAEDYASDQR